MILLTFSPFWSSLDDLSAGPLFCGLENMGSNFLCPSTNGSEKSHVGIHFYKILIMSKYNNGDFLPGKNSDA